VKNEAYVKHTTSLKDAHQLKSLFKFRETNCD